MTTTTDRRFKIICYTIQGMGSFALSFYFYYIYFLMRDEFGFTGRDNLAFAALNGLVYAVGPWQAGRLGQRFGYFKALKFGFGLMILAVLAGSQLHFAAGLVLASAMLGTGMCFLWPTLEALVSEGEDAEGLPRAVGLYNITWAATNALALFSGGTLVEKFGFKTIFYVPLALLLVQLVLVFRLEKLAPAARSTAKAALPPDPRRPSPAKTRAFLRMAWLANPLAYVAIYTIIPLLPTLAARFHLTPMFAGFACSLWGFVRLGAFIVLWRWTGWHYRFRWLVTACALIVVSFATILIVPSLLALMAAQLFFGAAVGLIYYSSLFYSMDAGSAKGEHGGIHEATIGLGNCIGPGVGAASLEFLPQYPHSGVIAVSVLLLFGLGGLVTIWKTARE